MTASSPLKTTRQTFPHTLIPAKGVHFDLVKGIASGIVHSSLKSTSTYVSENKMDKII